MNVGAEHIWRPKRAIFRSEARASARGTLIAERLFGLGVPIEVSDDPWPQVAARVGDLPGVVEQGRVESRPDFVAVLRLREQQVRTAKPIIAEPSQGIVTAQCGHQIERHA